MRSTTTGVRRIASIVFTLGLSAGTLAWTAVTEAGAAAPTVIIHSFSGPDGRLASTGLVKGGNGVVYGTTRAGGPVDKGTIFRLTPPAAGTQRWTYTLLHAFQGPADGSEPMGDPILGRDGALYGPAWTGGSLACGGGCGVVYRLAPPAAGRKSWSISILHFFQGAPADGATPIGGLIFGPGGVLYGTTLTGGQFSRGSVFKLSPPKTAGADWRFQIIASFRGGLDGDQPWGSLTIDPDGRLFGTTTRGGSSDCDCGTVFMLTPPAQPSVQTWTKTYLRRFRGLPDGSNPYSKLVLDDAGSLYGTTFLGGSLGYGTVFKLTPQPDGRWVQRILTNFNSGQGSGPLFTGPLAVDSSGALYGTTLNSSVPGSAGTVFKLTPPPANAGAWTQTTLHTFMTGGHDGNSPNAAVIRDKLGRLFGTTVLGGNSGIGTVFTLTP